MAAPIFAGIVRGSIALAGATSRVLRASRATRAVAQSRRTRTATDMIKSRASTVRQAATKEGKAIVGQANAAAKRLDRLDALARGRNATERLSNPRFK